MPAVPLDRIAEQSGFVQCVTIALCDHGRQRHLYSYVNRHCFRATFCDTRHGNVRESTAMGFLRPLILFPWHAACCRFVLVRSPTLYPAELRFFEAKIRPS